MITWRTELHLTCDVYDLKGPAYYPYCSEELILDQVYAKTRKGMFRVAKDYGWTWDGNLCLCPSCSKQFPGLRLKTASARAKAKSTP
jgi:hypothetical protein